MGKAVKALMKVIHFIEGDTNKVKISLWKIKQPNLQVLEYFKGVNKPGKKLRNTYIPSERENIEKDENI